MISYLRPKTSAVTTVLRKTFANVAGDDWTTDNSAHLTRSQATIDGQAVMRCTVGANATTYFNMSQAISPTVDLNNCHGILRLRVDASLPLPAAIELRYNNSGDGTMVTHTIWSWRAATYKRADGWLTIPITSAALLTATNSNTTRLGLVSKIWLTVSFGSGDTGTIDMAELHLWQAPSKGKLMIRMDDALAVQVTRSEECLARGITPHIAVIPTLLGTGVYATLAQMLALQDQGVILLNHWHHITQAGYADATHDGWVTTNGGGAQTVAFKRADYAAAAALMTSGGFDTWARYTVVPGGYEGTGDLSLLAEGLVDAIWYTYAGTVGEAIIGAGGSGIVQGYNWPLRAEQARMMATCNIWDSKTAAEMKADVDRCIAGKTFYPIHCHQPTQADWIATLDYIAAAVQAGTLEVVTLADLWHQDDAYQLATDQATVAAQLLAQAGQIVNVNVLEQEQAGTAVTEATAQTREAVAEAAQLATDQAIVAANIPSISRGATFLGATGTAVLTAADVQAALTAQGLTGAKLDAIQERTGNLPDSPAAVADVDKNISVTSTGSITVE
jgi:hypothetical protein